MLSSDLYHSDALNYLMLFFPDQITNFDNFRKVYTRSTLYTASWSASLRCFYLICYHSDTVQLITVTQKHCFHLSVSTWMILCWVLHILCYSLGSVKVGTRPWCPVHIQNYLPVNSSMTCAMKDNSWNSQKYLITFYIISWVIIMHRISSFIHVFGRSEICLDKKLMAQYVPTCTWECTIHNTVIESENRLDVNFRCVHKDIHVAGRRIRNCVDIVELILWQLKN